MVSIELLKKTEEQTGDDNSKVSEEQAEQLGSLVWRLGRRSARGLKEVKELYYIPIAVLDASFVALQRET
jgi:hypothetical protein